MPVSVKDIAKNAEFSHMLGIIAHRIAYPFYSEVQGGLENVAHSLIIGNSLFASTYLNDGEYMRQRLSIITPLRPYCP